MRSSVVSMLMSRSFKIARKDNYLRLFQRETRSLLFALSFSFSFFFFLLFFFFAAPRWIHRISKNGVSEFPRSSTSLMTRRRNSIAREPNENAGVGGRTGGSSVPTVPSSLIFSSSREVFLRFEETVSGFPQHLRALRKIRGQNAVARVCDGERPRSSFSPRSSPLSPSYILYFRKTASALLGRASHSRIYDYETCF